MTIFKSKTLSVWQLGAIKLAALSVGIAIGAQWNAAFLPYVMFLAGFGIVLGLCMFFVWNKN